jgi:hypothetical protein
VVQFRALGSEYSIIIGEGALGRAELGSSSRRGGGQLA